MSSDRVLIVGGGIAGINIAWELINRSIEFDLVDQKQPNSATRVAVGLYNPIVLKRNSLVWSSKPAWKLLTTYRDLERELQVKFIQEEPFYKKLNNQEEYSNWQLLSSDDRLNDMVTLSHSEFCGSLSADYGFGVVSGVGTLNTNQLITAFHNQLRQLNSLIYDSFSMSSLSETNEGFIYREQKYSHLIFTNGVNTLSDTPFSALPIQPNKGEWIRLKCKGLSLEGILNSSVFIKPETMGEFTVGATYDRHRLSPLITEGRKAELLEKFTEVTGHEPGEVVDHQGGLRPTSPDRKPMVGEHPIKKNIYVLNGLGSRGILHAPLMARWLLDYMFEGIPIDPKVDVLRFKKRLLKS